MNLKKLFSWASQEQDLSQREVISQVSADSEGASRSIHSNLAYLNANPNQHEFEDHLNIYAAPVIRPPKIKGLMDAPEMEAFFAQNYFGLGRHNGAIFRSMEGHDLGKAELIAKFQNTAHKVMGRLESKIDRLQSESVAMEGLSAPTSKRLELACQHLSRELKRLQTQIDQSAEGKGWVLEALNRYQIGFHKGMCEAIEFELLAG